jgi:hypothetical protein
VRREVAGGYRRAVNTNDTLPRLGCAVVGSTLIALVVAPALVGLSTVAARRWGQRAGGVVSAFPAIVGPVLLIVALAHGPRFAARAANGTLLGLVSLAAFAVAYGRVARLRGWRASLTAGWAWAAVTGLAVALAAGDVGSPAGLVVAAAGLGVACRALPPAGPGETPLPLRRGGIPLRMATAALLVALLSAAAGALGPLVGGMLAALPVLACVLAVFTHREAGAPAAIGLLRGLVAGMASFVVFCQLIGMLIGRYGIAVAFAAATLAAVLAQALTVYSVHSLLRRQSSSASPAVAAGAGSWRRQSS